MQVTKPDHLVDLGVGQPDPDLLPVGLFQSSALARHQLAYGAEIGDARFRQTLATWLTADCGCTVAPDNLMVTTGSSNALDMICTRLARAGDTVLVESPTYFIALNQLAEHGLNVVGVPLDDEGIQLGMLESALRRHKPAFIYTIPSFQNPTGITQSDTRRRQLVSLAKQYQCPLVADEVYQSLYFGDRPPPPLACYDGAAPVLSIGTFSKILAPGLRLGWIHGGGELLESLVGSALLKSGGGLAPVTSALVEPLIANGEFQCYLAGLRQTYQSRMEILRRELSAGLGARFDINKAGGGYFLWLTDRRGEDVFDKLAEARKAGVSFLAGKLFSDDPTHRACMRLCFAWYGDNELKQAAGRLASVFA